MSVPVRVNLVTFGMSDLARATAFYQALGWPLASASVDSEVSFFRTGGCIVGLWGRDNLAADAHVPATHPQPFGSTALAINVESSEAVTAALDAAVSAGATLCKTGEATNWGGFSGYFADLDGHHWKVAHNPFWPIDSEG